MTNTTIIANGTVLTCDAANRFGRFHIAIGNGRFLKLSENLDALVRDYPDATIVDASNRLIVPGFVNAHYHGESFLFRYLTAGLHFSLWKEDAHFAQALDRLLHSSSYEDVRRLYRAAYFAHLMSGSTCVGEFPPRFDENAFAQMLEGIASTQLNSVITVQTWEQIAAVQSLREKKPHVAINVGDEEELTVYSIEKLVLAAKDLKVPLLAHVAERREGANIIRQNFQKDILPLLSSFNAFRQNTILVHANHCSEQEVMMVKDTGGTVIVCARSTAAKQTGYPSLRHLAKRHVRIALGTDWGNVDMMDEMRFMSQLPLIIPGLRTFSSLEILRMATINGAHALGLAAEIGSIEAGKQADCLLFATDALRIPPLMPGITPEGAADIVVHHLTTGDIRDVMLRGVVLHGEQTRNAESARGAAEDYVAALKKFFAHALPSAAHLAEHPHDDARNVLPFSADPRSTPEDHEGFEKGFPAADRKATIVEIAETPSSSPRPTPQREPVKPELPSDTRRVFGEDDDV